MCHSHAAAHAQHKQHVDPLLKTLLPSATSVQTLHRVPLSYITVLKRLFLSPCADDGAEEAEATNWSSWSSPSHEHQPPAACLRALGGQFHQCLSPSDSVPR